ncbi:phosphonate ABC transporter, permease protein PhnE [Acerihabitans sp. TG2]|uniref:phosphonate ABC transporter, permease protein PhnE n=1 Tax=Acerihabitans sp. TG2 TaxID=3096008 RepID=UPI002B23D610|nr:phosphonate ABC transporter, permease protein PhnE [Acerihabitans sp. TG2]MEA9389653.1 phosphonate ABC transporter, permease protein PhnE [Acerihabitans sp. TG2]
MLTHSLSPQAVAEIRQQHRDIFAGQNRYLRRIGLIASIMVLYYVYFFLQYGLPWPRLVNGSQQIGHYFLRMLIWHDVASWPFGYYLWQIFITIAIVLIGSVTATLIALPLSFLAARNVMSAPLLRPIASLFRHFFDVLRGIDMAIWGMVFVRALGMGPLAGVMAIIFQDVGLLGKLYAEGHEAVERSPGRGLTALGANNIQKYRFGIFTQSFPTFLALSLYQIESNTRSAAVLGFVGAGGVGLVYAENMRLWNWDVVMFITIIMVGIVMLMDKMSAILRNKYSIGEEIPLYRP